MSRRSVLKGTGLAGLLALLPTGFLEACTRSSAASSATVFSDRQAAVVREATARLIPGPSDDSSEVGHPGAREANVTRYIETMLGAFSFRPAEIFASGPFSNRGEHDRRHGDLHRSHAGPGLRVVNPTRSTSKPVRGVASTIWTVWPEETSPGRPLPPRTPSWPRTRRASRRCSSPTPSRGCIRLRNTVGTQTLLDGTRSISPGTVNLRATRTPKCRLPMGATSTCLLESDSKSSA